LQTGFNITNIIRRWVLKRSAQKMKAFNHSDEWRERFLNMLELYGDFPNKYPFKAWKSRLASDSVSLDMLEGWMTASLIYSGSIEQDHDGRFRHTQKFKDHTCNK